MPVLLLSLMRGPSGRPHRECDNRPCFYGDAGDCIIPRPGNPRSELLYSRGTERCLHPEEAPHCRVTMGKGVDRVDRRRCPQNPGHTENPHSEEGGAPIASICQRLASGELWGRAPDCLGSGLGQCVGDTRHAVMAVTRSLYFESGLTSSARHLHTEVQRWPPFLGARAAMSTEGSVTRAHSWARAAAS